ncbi:hypothetical protein Ciccas_011140 [Cichlidogyrus casuarinus]|uniref:Fibronectin type-III domain-containing protein n=1 Tax=Cichlidogyrus casuarinus TaxID=1844966 RepID=A0ABD2PWU4_9PLAT
MSELNSQRLSNLQPSKTYSVSVSVIETTSGLTGSDASTKFTTTALPSIVVPIPTSLAAITITGSSIDLVWSAPTPPNGITLSGYEVVYSGPGGKSQTALVTSAIPIITITKLQPCTFYSISVKAVGTQTGGGKIKSDSSEPLEITTAAGTPEPVDSVTVTPLNDKTVKVEIIDSLSRNCATPSYTVSIRNSDTKFSFASSTLPGKTFLFDGLKIGTNYEFFPILPTLFLPEQ